MREIKFRGYDGMDWIYGSAIQYDKDTDTWYMIENGSPDDDWVMVGEIGQYTGARDKNNKEIYEGDICYFTPMLVETVPTFKGVIEWDNYRFTIRNLDYDVKNYLTTPYVNLDLFCVSVQKIGNIHENPELL